MYLKEFVKDKIEHSDTRDLDVAIEAVLEYLQRVGIITDRQLRNLPHADLDLDVRKSGIGKYVGG